jgi:hypothetical protein
MIHLSIFGSHGGTLSAARRLYITAFGGCELRVATVAKQIVERRQQGHATPQGPGHIFVTLFGGTALKLPTLAQEYLDLQEQLRAGLLTLTDWDRAVGQLSGGNTWSAGSLTLFGSFSGEELPSEDEELDDLALNRQLGYIPDEALDLLMQGVGLRGSSRPAVVRQALASALAKSA